MKTFDVDIDFQTTFDPVKVIPGAIRASQIRDGQLVPHPCGAYLQDVPIDPQTGLAAAPYELAEELGCFKIDFLHLNVLDKFNNRDDMIELTKIEPDWNLLLIPSIVRDLFHVKKHGDLLIQVKPKSILDLADVLALIRPQKRYILPFYLKDRMEARKILYTREEGEAYGFKKAHAISYAMIIVLQLHLAKAGIPL